MLRNYLKIAWRSLLKQPGFACINVFGLSAGLTCFALIALWVGDELSYDRFNEHYERIVRLTTTEKNETGSSEKQAFAVSNFPARNPAQSTVNPESGRVKALNAGH